MIASTDIGRAVLDFLFEAMKIDGAWSVRGPRSFEWWGQRLAQRVWAEPVRSSYDHHLVRVHAATAVLRDVRDTPDTRARLAATNMFMSLSALVWSLMPTSKLRGSPACSVASRTSPPIRDRAPPRAGRYSQRHRGRHRARR